MIILAGRKLGALQEKSTLLVMPLGFRFSQVSLCPRNASMGPLKFN